MKINHPVMYAGIFYHFSEFLLCRSKTALMSLKKRKRNWTQYQETIFGQPKYPSGLTTQNCIVKANVYLTIMHVVNCIFLNPFGGHCMSSVVPNLYFVIIFIQHDKYDAFQTGAVNPFMIKTGFNRFSLLICCLFYLDNITKWLKRRKIVWQVDWCSPKKERKKKRF